jgi:hypothetical protein
MYCVGNEGFSANRAGPISFKIFEDVSLLFYSGEDFGGCSINNAIYTICQHIFMGYLHQ